MTRFPARGPAGAARLVALVRSAVPRRRKVGDHVVSDEEWTMLQACRAAVQARIAMDEHTAACADCRLYGRAMDEPLYKAMEITHAIAVTVLGKAKEGEG